MRFDLRRVLAYAREPWRAYVAAGVLGIAGYLLCYDAAGLWLFPLLAATCPVMVALGLVRNRPAKAAPWWLLCAGYGLLILGDAAWSVLELASDDEMPALSVADVLYLSGYPFLALGLLVLVRHDRSRSRLERWLDGGMLTFTVVGLGWVFLLDPSLDGADSAGLDLAVRLAYPLADLVLLGMAGRLLLTTGVRTASFRLLLGSLVAMLVADTIYLAGVQLYGDVNGEAVGDGLWLASYVLLGAAALHRSMQRTADLPEGTELHLAGGSLAAFLAFALVGPVAAIFHRVTDDGQEPAGWDTVLDTSALVLTTAGPALLLVVRLALVARMAQAHARELGEQTLALKEALREQLALQGKLSHQAMHDPLTGLANRSLLQDRLEHTLARGAEDAGLLLLDLDGFKDVNDTLGHPVGDELLIAAAGRLLGAVRVGDTLARLGGDEFAVIFENVTPAQLQTRAQQVLAELRAPFVAAGRQLYLTGSIGALMLAPSTTTSEALRSADLALYAAKDAGKDRVETFHPSMGTARVDYAKVATGLRRALVRDEFELHYQPIVNLETGVVEGVEALLRWDSPELGHVPPAEFIPVAEDTGLIAQLGAWVLREACRQLGEWRRRRDAGAPPLSVTVNVSGYQLREPGFVRAVKQELRANALDPRTLVIEITETVLITTTDTAMVREHLAELRELGVRIAIDDFGTGYSSLAYLRHLPVDVVKLDRAFIQGDDRPGQDWTLTRAILTLSEGLGLRAVAEGVETAEQAEQLRRLGCPLAQGFYFARPMPADEAEKLFSSRPSPVPVNLP
jgi:diguanylate cyclase (GGDEF)-like protein